MTYNYITYRPSVPTSISIMGYNYTWLDSVFLSSGDVTFPSLTSIDRYTLLRKVSSACPSFTAYMLPTSAYNILDRNRIKLSISTALTGVSGLIDVIFAGPAGYSKLSDRNYLIKYINN